MNLEKKSIHQPQGVSTVQVQSSLETCLAVGHMPITADNKGLCPDLVAIKNSNKYFALVGTDKYYLCPTTQLMVRV